MSGLITLIVLCVFLCPLSLVFIFGSAIINRIRGSTSFTGELVSAALGVILLVVGYKLGQPFIPPVITYIWQCIFGNSFQSENLFDLWIKSNLTTLGISVIITHLCILFLSLTPERMMLMAEEKEEKSKLRIQKIDYVPKRSQVIYGVSGAGKSAFIAKSTEDIIISGKDSDSDSEPVIYIVDGKGSTEKYSLYYSCKLLSKKYNVPLTLINGTANRKLGGVVYDFLDGVETVDSAKDMIMTLLNDPLIKSSSDSEHYKTMTESYLTEVIECMRRHKIDETIKNVLTLLDPEVLISALTDAGAPASEISEMQKFANDAWPSVRDNAAKLKMFLKGEGAEIFTGSGERANVRSAYQKGGIVLVLADEMSRPKLAGKLVQLVSMDLRFLVSARLTGMIDTHKKLYIYYDEFSSYVSSITLIRNIYSKCRSSDTVMTIATQSCADIIGIDSSWFDILANTADRFIIFRQHAASAEAASSIFGTKAHVTQTARSSDMTNTGESSNTVDRAFTIPPDVIRKLPNNVGILLDMTANPEEQIKCFRNKFVKP